MTHTGKEPYKDPYAFGFSRDGQPLWQLWNPDLKLQRAAKLGGNGLMADTTGHFAAATTGGKLLLERPVTTALANTLFGGIVFCA
jgi:hypothetical protein